MSVMVVGRFHVKRGSEDSFEQAFAGRPPASGPRPPVEEVYFGRSGEAPSRYCRVGIWRSRHDWEAFLAEASI